MGGLLWRHKQLGWPFCFKSDAKNMFIFWKTQTFLTMIVCCPIIGLLSDSLSSSHVQGRPFLWTSLDLSLISCFFQISFLHGIRHLKMDSQKTTSLCHAVRNTGSWQSLRSWAVESPSPTSGFSRIPRIWYHILNYTTWQNRFSAFTLNYLSGVVTYIIVILCTFCFLPGCVCIFLLDLSGSRKLWVFLYLTNSQVCRWVLSHRSGPHVQNVDVSNTEGRRFSWLPWHPTHHYSPGNWS